MSEVRDDAARSRYELAVDGASAIAVYERRGDVVVFTHTEVPQALEGRGIGGRLIKGALADVRARGFKVIPACEFVATYIARRPEEHDLLAE